jgi:hypothetical protein
LLINIPRYGPQLSKLHDAVSVDERIDLASFVPGGEDYSCVYELDSMALHRGDDLRSGHCTSLIKTPDGWKLCDDSECTLLPRGIPRSHQKEVVFAVYRRCESPPPESNPRPICKYLLSSKASSKTLASHIFHVLLHTAESMVKELLINLSVSKMGEEMKESNDPKVVDDLLGEYLPAAAFVILVFSLLTFYSSHQIMQALLQTHLLLPVQAIV